MLLDLGWAWMAFVKPATTEGASCGVTVPLVPVEANLVFAEFSGVTMLAMTGAVVAVVCGAKFSAVPRIASFTLPKI